MRCDELSRRLTDHAEGALDPQTAAAVEEHLASCARCAALQADLADLARLCRAAEAPTTMPAELRERVVALLSSAPPPGRPTR